MIIFIPIKQNSQRVKNKNFRLFGEDPLYIHTLLKLNKFTVYVDTDSEIVFNKIKEDPRFINVICQKRPSHLVGDKVSVNKIIKDFVVRNDIKDDVCQIHVTSPFLK